MPLAHRSARLCTDLRAVTLRFFKQIGRFAQFILIFIPFVGIAFIIIFFFALDLFALVVPQQPVALIVGLSFVRAVAQQFVPLVLFQPAVQPSFELVLFAFVVQPLVRQQPGVPQQLGKALGKLFRRSAQCG